MPDINAAKNKIKEWKHNPSKFVMEVMGAKPDPWQHEVLAAFPKNKFISMKACKGPGKSCLLAWIAWNFMLTRNKPKIICTSITSQQLYGALWPEIFKWYERSKILKENFICKARRIEYRHNPKIWYMEARTWGKPAKDSQQQSSSIAGIHAENLLMLVDECSEIPDSIFTSLRNCLTSGVENKLVMAGNPLKLSGPLYRSCTAEKKHWWTISISAAPDDPKRTPRVDIEHARREIDTWGKDNPWVMCNIYGQFPPASINSLLGVEEVEEAINREVKHEDYIYSQPRLGVDVARYGDDSTVIFPRQGLKTFMPIELKNADTQTIAGRIRVEKVKYKPEMMFIDSTGGFGAGVIDSLLQMNDVPIPVNFSEKADESKKYYNKRAEMYFRLSQWIKRGGSLPNVPELVAELTKPTYTTKDGRLIIQPKEQIKRELGRSPDFSDALATSFAIIEMPANTIERMISGRSHGRQARVPMQITL